MTAAVPPGFRLRSATAADAEAVRTLVFGVLHEYGLRPDPDVADRDLAQLTLVYGRPGAAFSVLEDPTGRLVGTVGLLPREADTVELRKMYLVKDQRGRGLGRLLLEHALETARGLGHRRMILETATVLREAILLYERYGFVRLPGSPEVCRCDLVMARDLG